MTTRRLLDWIARKRGLMLALPLAFTTVCFWGEFEVDLVLWPLGAILILAGIGLRVWAQRYIHWHALGQGILAMGGPYAMLRNPLYVGNLLLLLGATVLSELLWFLPVMAASWFAVYSITVRSEERRCTAKFGASYRRYLAAVPRWFPRLRRPTAARGGAGRMWGPLLSELRCLLVLLPCAVKEVASGWMQG